MNALKDWLSTPLIEGQDSVTNLDRLSLGLQAAGSAMQGNHQQAGAFGGKYAQMQDTAKRKQAISGLMGDLGIAGPQAAMLDSMPIAMQQQYLMQKMQADEADKRARARAAAAASRSAARGAASQAEFARVFGAAMGEGEPAAQSAPMPGSQMAPGQLSFGAPEAEAPQTTGGLSFGSAIQEPAPVQPAQTSPYDRYKTAYGQALNMAPSPARNKVLSELEKRMDFYKPEEPVEREMYEAADGYNYWKDAPTERVNPDINVDNFDADRYRVVGNQLFDLSAEGGPVAVGQGQGSEEVIYDKDGNPIVVRGPAGTNAKFTETQAKDNVFATRATGALGLLDSVGAENLTSRSDRVLDAIPLGVGREFQKEDFQVAQQSGDEFLQAILRKDTGAAITEPEQVLYGRTYLPQPGDGPRVLEAKRAARIRAVEALKSGMNMQQLTVTERAVIKAARKTEESKKPGAPDPSGASDKTNFTEMSRDQILGFDISTATMEDIAAWNEAIDRLEAGQ